MRAPFQVIVLPYRFIVGEYKILIGRRSDDGSWQAISGGGESTETPLQTAVRELTEESGLEGLDWVQLDSKCTLPRNMFPNHDYWSDHPFVIPEYAFMVRVGGNVQLSEEHSEFRWCTELEARSLLRYDSNKNAVWELFQRLKQII